MTVELVKTYECKFCFQIWEEASDAADCCNCLQTSAWQCSECKALYEYRERAEACEKSLSDMPKDIDWAKTDLIEIRSIQFGVLEQEDEISCPKCGLPTEKCGTCARND